MPHSYQQLNGAKRTGPGSTIYPVCPLPHCSPANPNPNCAVQALHGVKPFSFVPKKPDPPGRLPAGDKPCQKLPLQKLGGRGEGPGGTEQGRLNLWHRLYKVMATPGMDQKSQ